MGVWVRAEEHKGETGQTGMRALVFDGALCVGDTRDLMKIKLFSRGAHRSWNDRTSTIFFIDFFVLFAYLSYAPYERMECMQLIGLMKKKCSTKRKETPLSGFHSALLATLCLSANARTAKGRSSSHEATHGLGTESSAASEAGRGSSATLLGA